LANLRSKFRGSIFGAAIGDTLGMPVEKWTIEKIRSELGEVKDMLGGRQGPPGTWTDDTAMTIAVAESLIECKGFDSSDMRSKFLRHYDPRRGFGLAVKSALGVLTEEARKAVQEQLKVVGMWNGSAMRIAPVGLFYYDDPVKLRQASHESSKITHDHMLAHEGAALQAYAIGSLVGVEPGALDPEGFLHQLEGFVTEDAYKEQLRKALEMMSQHEDKQGIANSLGNTAHALQSIPTAIYSFVTHREDFRDAVIYAVNLGGDADTIGSMTGALSGAYLGEEAIPSDWRMKVENASYLCQLADELFRLSTRNA